MKKAFILLLIFLTPSILLAQNELKAKIEFEEAEKAFNESKYEEAVNRLAKAEQFLGKWSPRLGYLKILALDKVANYNDIKNNYTVSLGKEVKQYMTYADANQDKIDMEKFKTVYTIEEKINYLKKVEGFADDPDWLNGREAIKNKDNVTAVKFWKAAAEKGNWLAMNWLSSMYENGFGTAKDYNLALEWNRKAAAQGYHEAHYDLGKMYENARGVTQDYKTALEHLMVAAEKGHIVAMNDVGEFYYYGRSVPKDYQQAVNWYRKSAEKGGYLAMRNMGYMYKYGQGVEKSYAESLNWYTKAYNVYPKNTAPPKAIASLYYTGGFGVNQSYSEAFNWYKKAADNGDEEAADWVGFLYQHGQGVAQDYAEALKWYQIAIEKGSVNAMKNIHTLYLDGLGVKKDKKLAAEWLAKYEAANAKK